MRSVSVFWRYFLSFFIAVFIPFAATSVFFSSQQQTLALRNTENYYQNILIEARDKADSVLDGIESAKFSIEHSLWFRDLCWKWLEDEPVLGMALSNEIQKSLAFICAQQRFSSISVSPYDSNTIYSSSGFYSMKLDYSTSAAFQDIGRYFFELAEGEPAGYDLFHLPGSTGDYIIYSSPISNYYYNSQMGRPKGNMNAAISCTALLEKCRPLLRSGMLLTISCTDGAGFSFSSGEEEPGNYHSISAASALEPSISYTLRIPETLYYAEAVQQRNSIILSLSAVSLLFLGMALLIAHYNFRPIRRLYTSIPSDDGDDSRNELVQISHGIKTMQKKYAAAANELSASKEKLLQYLFINLLFEINNDDIDQELAQWGISFPHRHFCAVAAYFPIADRWSESMSESRVSEIIQAFRNTCTHYIRHFHLEGYACQLQMGHFGIVINYDSAKRLRSFLTRLAHDCNACFGSEQENIVCFGVGSSCQRLDDISRSFDEACRAQEFNQLEQMPVSIRYAETETSSRPFYHYSTSDEAAFVNAVKKGDVERACTLIQNIISQNLKSETLDSYSVKCLHYQLLSTLIKTIRQLEFPIEQYVDTRAVGQMTSIRDIHRFLEITISKVCGTVQMNLDRNACGFEDELIVYVKEHLFQCNLSLQMVADYFDVSMAYISQVFKKKLGISYSDFVNRSRIDRAIELKQNPDYTLSMIAREVGYENMGTFRRNFVKYTGSTPGAADSPQAKRS